MNIFKINFIKIIISFLFITIFSACQEHNNEEDYSNLTYYEVIGKGYAYNIRKLNLEGIIEPVKFYRIMLYSSLEPTNLFSDKPIVKEYYTDENGLFIIKFPKSTDKRKVSYYEIRYGGYSPDFHTVFPARYIELLPTDTLKIDTIWAAP